MKLSWREEELIRQGLDDAATMWREVARRHSKSERAHELCLERAQRYEALLTRLLEEKDDGVGTSLSRA